MVLIPTEDEKFLDIPVRFSNGSKDVLGSYYTEEEKVIAESAMKYLLASKSVEDYNSRRDNSVKMMTAKGMDKAKADRVLASWESYGLIKNCLFYHSPELKKKHLAKSKKVF